MFQGSMALAVGGLALVTTRTRRRERLAAFERWLAGADFAELLEFAQCVARPPEPARRHRGRATGD